ncbi:MAG: hypothetical protein Q4C87_12135 [Actinomycetaceae bacterium]|nr:hypothetical protein [Actinomycetaceae bacterium]
MSSPSDRQKELLSLPRWSWLSNFIATWYAEPLSKKDALSAEFINGVTERLGVTIPEALREWYELVGARINSQIQDVALGPDEWQVSNSHLRFWVENRGDWWVGASLDQGSDPHVFAFGIREEPIGICSLSEWLRGRAICETRIGVWTGESPDMDSSKRVSFLGRLKPEIRGGGIRNVSEEIIHWVTQHFPQIPITDWPTFNGVSFGDTSTSLYVAKDSGYIEWMTATPEAAEEIKLGLRLFEVTHELVVTSDPINSRPDKQRARKQNGFAKEVYRSALASDECMSRFRITPESMSLFAVFTTPRPEDLAARLLAVTPTEYREAARFYSLPEYRGYLEEVYPHRHENIANVETSQSISTPLSPINAVPDMPK